MDDLHIARYWIAELMVCARKPFPVGPDVHEAIADLLQAHPTVTALELELAEELALVRAMPTCNMRGDPCSITDLLSTVRQTVTR
jgi:hypothetical protein